MLPRFPLSSVVVACILAGAASTAAQAAVITWDFGTINEDPKPAQKALAVSTLSITESSSGKTVSATAYILQTWEIGYGPGLTNIWQKDYSDEQGIGPQHINDHELSLKPTNGRPNSAFLIDCLEIQGYANGRIMMGSVQSNTADRWDVWGTNTPGIAQVVGFPGEYFAINATQLLSGQAVEGPVAVPQWGTYRYLFITSTPDINNASTSNVLFRAIDVDNVPEPASLGLLAVGGLALLTRRSRRTA